MPAQHARFAHDLDVHRLADIDAAQLRLLEVAVDAKRVHVHHRQHRPARRHVLAGTRRAVVQIAVDGAHDRRALQVQARGIDRDFGVRERGFRLLHASTRFLGRLARDQVAELAVAHVLAARLVECRTALLRGRLRLAQRERIARLVDHEERLAAQDPLIVDHLDLHDQPADVRRDLHDIGAHVPIARPRREHVVADQAPQHEARDHHDDQRKEDLSNGEPGFFHVMNRWERTTTAPSTST
ncbi:hypothetical protein AWB68_06651 [Caballeronia choica]|uniref:Uncharacterized protein n=1 Tax=Caballeronia choica TaxID=326476 RepID=A0A158KQC1_9BURK|nr:hypothetical protein AWB68_06651 [Caballeronia choica]